MKKHRVQQWQQKCWMLALMLLGAGTFLLSAQDYRSEFERFKRERQQEFEDHYAKANAEFTKHLKDAWAEFVLLPAEPLKPGPKPTPTQT